MAKIKNPAEGKLSARINLALPVKLAEDLKTLAFIDGTSVNDYARRILSAYVAACGDELEKYKSFREQVRNEKLKNACLVLDDNTTVGFMRIERDKCFLNNEQKSDD